MNTSANKTWFPAKKYGWGWGLPCAWQGWVVLALYFALLGVGVRYFGLPEEAPEFLFYVSVVSAALIVICGVKGERPRWRWGRGGK